MKECKQKEKKTIDCVLPRGHNSNNNNKNKKITCTKRNTKMNLRKQAFLIGCISISGGYLASPCFHLSGKKTPLRVFIQATRCRRDLETLLEPPQLATVGAASYRRGASIDLVRWDLKLCSTSGEFGGYAGILASSSTRTAGPQHLASLAVKDEQAVHRTLLQKGYSSVAWSLKN